MIIRKYTPEDREPLTRLWERSVRATHHFLGPEDINFYRPLVASGLETLDTWVLEAKGAPLGFMALDSNSVEALFLDPECRGRGGGPRLLRHAREIVGNAPLLLDVNEENPDGLGFYLAKGFIITGRSEKDSSGRPFPLLHLELRGPVRSRKNF